MKQYNSSEVMIMLNIKQIRIDKGYKQEEVAAVLKISRAAYTNIENGKRDPDTETLLKLADLFGISIDSMFGRVYAVPQQNDSHKVIDDLYDSVNIAGKRAIIEYATYISEKDEYKKVSVESAG